MKINQIQEFTPVTITLETAEEAKRLYTCLTNATNSLSVNDREFAYDMSELISKNTNTFYRGQS